MNGKIYDLDAHLDRFLKSAERSKLNLPCTRDEMRDIIIRTTTMSGLRDGSIRYWLTSGAGSLDLTPAPDAEPGFFVMIFGGLSYPDRWYTQGLRMMTTTYPIKPALYAITKATNYLPNVLMQMEAKEKGFDNGVFIDHEGHVGESSNMNVAFITRDNVLVHPKFDHILSGCTSQRVLQLALRGRHDFLQATLPLGLAVRSEDEAHAAAGHAAASGANPVHATASESAGGFPGVAIGNEHARLVLRERRKGKRRHQHKKYLHVPVDGARQELVSIKPQAPCRNGAAGGTRSGYPW